MCLLSQGKDTGQMRHVTALSTTGLQLNSSNSKNRAATAKRARKGDGGRKREGRKSLQPRRVAPESPRIGNQQHQPNCNAPMIKSTTQIKLSMRSEGDEIEKAQFNSKL